jgi:hypothetical protein
MLRIRPVLLSAVVCMLVVPSVASAAQRSYTITGGTTTITLSDAWLAALRAEGGQIAATGGATIVVVNPKSANPVYKLTIPIRKAPGAGVAYGTSQGTLMTVKHRGTVAIRSAAAGVTLNFQRPEASFSSPLLANTGNQILGTLVRPTGSGPAPFVTVGPLPIKKPRDGRVTVRKANVMYAYTGAGGEWYLQGSDALIKLPMGDLAMSVRVKRSS